MSDQPHTLTAADLTALPAGSTVRYATERGMRPAVAIKATNIGPGHDKWHSSDSMAPVTSLIIASNSPVLYAPGTSRERSAHDGGGVDAGLRCALVELADRWELHVPLDPEAELRAVLSASEVPGRQSQPQLGPLGDRGAQ